VNDDHMTGPGAHETSAHSFAMEGNTPQAQIYAILALASAVNRLASAQEAIANA
jgi:hypothetical protein